MKISDTYRINGPNVTPRRSSGGSRLRSSASLIPIPKALPVPALRASGRFRGRDWLQRTMLRASRRPIACRGSRGLVTSARAACAFRPISSIISSRESKCFLHSRERMSDAVRVNRQTNIAHRRDYPWGDYQALQGLVTAGRNHVEALGVSASRCHECPINLGSGTR